MSQKQRSITEVLTVAFLGIAMGNATFGQCDPPGPNSKCWENQNGNGDGLWNNILNWNPIGVPLDVHDVYHLIGGTITYNVPVGSPNDTVASFTAGESAPGLVINDGLELHVVGSMVSNTPADYALTVKSRADVTVGADVRDVRVTLENGVPGDETTVNISGKLTGGDWWVPQNARVSVVGSVDATGGKTWGVGGINPYLPGGVVAISRDALGGIWTVYGDDAEADPLTMVSVGGTIEGGCWKTSGSSCNGTNGPKAVVEFIHVMDGPDTCDENGVQVNLRQFGHFGSPKPLPGTVIEGGRWHIDGALAQGKIAQVGGGMWFPLHHTERSTFGGVTYQLNIGTMNLDPNGDCSTEGSCSVFMDSDLTISGPGHSYIPSLRIEPDGPPCTEVQGDGSIETAEGGTHANTLTFDILVMNGNSARAYINRNSSGANETDIVIQESATVISSEINARRLTVDNPDPLDIAVLELHSPGKSPSRINLAGPAEFGATGRCEIVYHNVNNQFFSRAEIVGQTAIGGFTLHDRAVIRANDSKAGSNLHLELAGHFDVRTTLRDPWDAATIPPTVVANHWDTRTTDLFLAGVSAPSEDPVKLEVFAPDIGDVVFTDTPCRGAMQDLTITGVNTIAELVDEHANNRTGCSDTLYFRNVTIDETAVLDVGSQVIYYYGLLDLDGQVIRNGIPLSQQEIDAVIVSATLTCFGDLDDDGDVDSKDVDLFCEAYGQTAAVCSVRADGDCDGDVDDADKLLMEAAFGSPIQCL